jgi:uncharacterized protein YndB with AHSA1/START domain
MIQLEHLPVVRVESLVRCPVSEAFHALTDPEVITKFWLSRVSGPLQTGTRVHWEFMVRGASAETVASEIVPNERVAFQWDDGTTVEWTFSEYEGYGSRVVVTQSGFNGTPDEVVAMTLEATSGFTLVLSELKVLLERGFTPNLVKDKALLIERARAEGNAPAEGSAMRLQS